MNTLRISHNKLLTLEVILFNKGDSVHIEKNLTNIDYCFSFLLLKLIEYMVL